VRLGTGLWAALSFVGASIALLASSPSCGLNAMGLGGDGGAVSTGLQGGGGQAPACTVPEECPGLDTDCWLRHCVQGLCSPEIVAAGTQCDDDEGQVCDGNSQCVDCLDQSTCAADELCKYHQCVHTHCDNAAVDIDETDVDCGGLDCAPCANGNKCLVRTDCLSGVCDLAGAGGGSAGLCRACATDQECVGAPAQWCNPNGTDGGTCEPKKDNGALCEEGRECASGFCPVQDKVCCDAACDDPCQACLLNKSGSENGMCAVVAAGQDPDQECLAVDLCGPTGAGCKGTEASCVFAVAGTDCEGWCQGNLHTAVNECDGSGTCVHSSQQQCNGFLMCAADGQTCLQECGGSQDCVAPYSCDTNVTPHVCTTLKPDGQPCGSGAECQSGNCPWQDLVCCNEPCDGTCRACADAKNGASPGGTCANIPNNQDPDDECPQNNNRCNGYGDCYW
jgi:hypothetical protein